MTDVASQAAFKEYYSRNFVGADFIFSLLVLDVIRPCLPVPLHEPVRICHDVRAVPERPS